MKLKPLPDRILCVPVKGEATTKSGLILTQPEEQRRALIEDEMSEGPEYQEREQLIQDNRKTITLLKRWAQLHGVELVESNHKKNKQEP